MPESAPGAPDDRHNDTMDREQGDLAWEAWVDVRLGGSSWPETTRRRVIEDVAAMLAAREQKARADGASRQEARAAAETLVPDWQKLAAQIEEARVDEARARRAIARTADRVATWRARLSTLAVELAGSLKLLTRSPAYAAAIVLTLALGIGANAAIFAVIDAVLLAPLPYPEPETLVRLYSTRTDEGIDRAGVSSGDIVDWRANNRALTGIAGWYVMGRTVVDDQRAEIVNVAQVSRDFFPVLGARPALGRTFTAEETARSTFNSAASPTGADPVVVLSHDAWQRLFGGDPMVLDQRLTLDRQSWRILGVMPPSFSFPTPEVDAWIPWSFAGERPHDQRYLAAVARLRPDVTLEQASSQMDRVAATLADELPESNQGWGVELVPLRDDLLGASRPILGAVLAAVALVLLIAALNLSCLQLARLGAREREMALRLTLGSSRSRLARRLMLENLWPAVFGGALAVLITSLGTKLAGATLPASLPRLDQVAVTPRVLAVVAALTLGVSVVLCLVPLTAARRSELSALASAAGRAVGGSAQSERARGFLVACELAVAVAVLVAAGLLLRSFDRLLRVDVGFRPDQVAVLPITLDNHEYETGSDVRAYYRALLNRLAAVRGVISAAGVTALPGSPIGPDFDRPVWADGETPPAGGGRRSDVRMATPGYFETLGIPLLRGRDFDDGDHPDAPRVVVINQTLAEQTWPGEDPIGRRLVIDYSTAGTYPYEVVGLVQDVRFHGIRSEPRAELYLPHAQRPYLILNVAVRTDDDPAALLPALRRAVLEVDPMQPAYEVRPLADLVASSIARERFATLLFAGFAAISLALALVGILWVFSHHASRRTREIGVRAALGASRLEILRMILFAGLRLSALGVGAGALIAVAATRWLEHLLFEVGPGDPATYALVAVMTTGCALAACYLPARRAARVDPAVALHQPE